MLFTQEESHVKLMLLLIYGNYSSSMSLGVINIPTVQKRDGID